MTVGESSGCGDTSDESCRNQPRASGSEEDNEHSTNRDTSFDEGILMKLVMPLLPVIVRSKFDGLQQFSLSPAVKQ